VLGLVAEQPAAKKKSTRFPQTSSAPIPGINQNGQYLYIGICIYFPSRLHIHNLWLFKPSRYQYFTPRNVFIMADEGGARADNIKKHRSHWVPKENTKSRKEAWPERRVMAGHGVVNLLGILFTKSHTLQN